MGKIAQRIIDFVRENRREAEILFLILLLSFILRVFRIDEYMTFLGDEGRDAIIVRRLLVYLDPILVGPGTSIGNMYLGPLYYYMMAPALWLFRFHPVGPAFQIALLSVATTLFVWYVARSWFGKKAAIVSSLFYAIAPTVIIFGRSSWNPNIMPFFSLLTIWGIWKFWQEKKFVWIMVTGVSLAFVLQSHYLGLLLVPALGAFWFLTLLKVRKAAKELKRFLSFSLGGLLIFLFLMSPIVIFDARHGWRNFSAMKTFFAERQTTVSAKPWNAIPKLPELSWEVSTSLLGGRNVIPGRLSFYALILMAIYLTLKRRDLLSNEKKAYLLISVWLGFALVGLGLYKQEIYDHYFGFFFAAPFLLLGGMVERVGKLNKEIAPGLILGLLLLGITNLNSNPLKYPPNRQYQRSLVVTDRILEEAGDKEFNLAVIAERNYEDGYQYVLEVKGGKVVDIDAQKTETITDTLFVVCEMPKEKCNPTTSPKAEVANFGWSKVAGEWEEGGVLIFKLEHTI